MIKMRGGRGWIPGARIPASGTLNSAKLVSLGTVWMGAWMHAIEMTTSSLLLRARSGAGVNPPCDWNRKKKPSPPGGLAGDDGGTNSKHSRKGSWVGQRQGAGAALLRIHIYSNSCHMHLLSLPLSLFGVPPSVWSFLPFVLLFQPFVWAWDLFPQPQI